MPARRADVLVTCVCAAVILAVIPVRPFWLDEVLQLIGTRPERSVREVIEYVPENPGSAPLGYLIQYAFLKLLGVSRWSVRLPSALFAIAACVATLALARRLGLARPWLAPLVLISLPLMLRYATEGRPYSQAVFLSVLATILFLRFAESRRAAMLAAYVAVLLAGVYTLPFTVFVAGGHAIWAIAVRRRPLAGVSSGSALLAAASFVPWIRFARAKWQQTMVAARFQFTAGWKTPLMLFRELSGAGYWGSGLLLVLVVIGARTVAPATAVLLGGIAAVTLIGGIAADAAFGYFIAARQFVCALPPLAILAAARPMKLLVIALLAVCALKNWQYFTSATEDWESAAVAIRSELLPGRCLIVEPERERRVYAALVPDLAETGCTTDAPEIVVAVSPWRQPGPLTPPEGYSVRSERSAGGTRILVLSR